MVAPIGVTVGVEAGGFAVLDTPHFLTAEQINDRALWRHRWRSRRYLTPAGEVECRCTWWRRLWLLARGR